jgi:hypothetical protein
MIVFRCLFGHYWKQYSRLAHRPQPGVLDKEYNYFRVCLRCGKRERV